MELRTFDRSKDISKLEGCNTRNIEYRWDLFCRELPNIPRGGEALDFGAGSLRDSFELTKRGYSVTSIDLNADLLASYEGDYDWPNNGTMRKFVTGRDLQSCISQIHGERFSLVICFDVLEHLEDPIAILREMRTLVPSEGRLFITVPNGRSLFELYFRFMLLLAKAVGKKLRPGGASPSAKFSEEVGRDFASLRIGRVASRDGDRILRKHRLCVRLDTCFRRWQNTPS